VRDEAKLMSAATGRTAGPPRMTLSHGTRLVTLLYMWGSPGCGSVSNAPDAQPEFDGAPIDGAPIDASPLRCDITKRFGDVREVPGINGPENDSYPSLSPDELTIYFASNRAAPGTGNYDIYVANRASRDDAFEEADPLPKLITSGDDSGPSISSDGRTLFFHSSGDVFVSTRSGTGASVDFGDPVGLSSDINSATFEGNPFITADGQTLYFDRTSNNNATIAIMRASLGPTGFGSPTPVAELDTFNAETSMLSANGLTIFFASDRAGGLGGPDIWTAARSTPTGVFDQIENVAVLNTTEQEYPTSLSPDGCRIYFYSNRSGGSGGLDLWQATRPQ
jgi:Tol biopolymer transport system component